VVVFVKCLRSTFIWHIAIVTIVQLYVQNFFLIYIAIRLSFVTLGPRLYAVRIEAICIQFINYCRMRQLVLYRYSKHNR